MTGVVYKIQRRRDTPWGDGSWEMVKFPFRLDTKKQADEMLQIMRNQNLFTRTAEFRLLKVTTEVVK